MTLPDVQIGNNVPEEALRRKNDKIWGMDTEQQRKTISAYMASVRFMDQQVGRLLGTLDRFNLREETIVIFISDHGYNLGEHDCWSKTSLWEGSVRVPLIISVPGSESSHGTSSNSITELIDLYPALTELCGFKGKEPHILQGKSLVENINHPEKTDTGNIAFSISYGGNAGTIRTDKYRYSRWRKNPEIENEELYNHEKDQEEYYNLAGNPEFNPILEEIRSKFETALKRASSDLN